MQNQMDRIEWKLDQILSHLLSQARADGISSAGNASQTHHQTSIPQVTTKQFAALQMLMRGASNAEIAERFNVSENTAKVYVRTIAKKLGVNTRAQIVREMLPILSTVDDNSYRLASGGLPLDWDELYENDDPFAGLYRREDDITTQATK